MLNVFSIFQAISGEIGAVPQGHPSAFVRLAGCTLSCNYCDAKDSQSSGHGEEMTAFRIGQVIDEMGLFNHLVITGGEPLFQWDDDEMGQLLRLASKKRWAMTVETNGRHPCPKEWDQYTNYEITWVVDYKLPGSGMNQLMSQTIEHWKDWPDGTWIKMVCSDMEDFEHAYSTIDWMKGFAPHLNFAVGAIRFDLLGEIAELVLERNMHDVVVNCQIHKILFPLGEKGDSLKETD